MQRFSALLIFLFCLAVYLINPDPMFSGDMNSNSVFALNLLEYRTFALSPFADSHFYKATGGFSFTVGVPGSPGEGQLTLSYPVGVAVFTLPIYLVFFVWLKLFAPAVGMLSADFDAYRVMFSHLAAVVYAAATVALFFLICRARFSLKTAVIISFCFAFASQQWGLLSQSLLQQGVSAFVIVAIAYLMVPTDRGDRRQMALLLAAGLFAGLLFLIRPTNLVFTLTFLAFAVLWFGRRSIPFLLTCVAGLSLSIAWNWYYFATVLGAATIFQTHSFHFSMATFLAAFLGLTASPNHGVFATAPFFIFAIVPMVAALAGAVRTTVRWDFARANPIDLLFVLLLGASLVLLINYSFSPFWSAGTHGGRYLAETTPVAAYYLGFFVERLSRMPRRVKALAIGAFAVLTFVGFFNQLTVLVAGHQGLARWAGQPIGEMDAAVDRRWDYLHQKPLVSLRTRAWSVRDGLIARTWRGVYADRYVLSGPIAGATSYAARCRATIVAMHDMSGAPVDSFRLARVDDGPYAQRIWDLFSGGRKYVRANIRNDGQVPLYGPETGLAWGVATLVHKVVDAEGKTVREGGTVYVSGTIKPGEGGIADGSMEISYAKGRYTITGRMAIQGLGYCGDETPLGTVVVE